tara:strand:+ start:23666 stop:25600 length:1935 start_codon:yes stop_codon:yes gene_type:complete
MIPLILLTVSAATIAETPVQATSIARTTAQVSPYLDFKNSEDHDFASRGFIATRTDPEIKDESGKVVLDLREMDYLNLEETKKTINPSLLRHAQLLNEAGLFAVTENVYQVRGFDLANFTFIRGDTGWIVIDTGSSPVTARAAYELVSEQLGSFPIKAIIYTHSHADHFGGTSGLVSQAEVDVGKVEIIAPQGFMEHTIQEWLVTGNAMLRRAQYQGGPALPRNATGYVSFGLGNRIPHGSWSLVAPTLEINQPVTKHSIDGLELVFQLTPGTEAPAEMNIFIPKYKVLDMAENASPMMHQIYTLRGAEVRDAAFWAEQLGESITLFGDKTETMISSHGWPRFGHTAVISYLEKHRDLYKFLHDQTIRLINQGMNAEEIAHHIELPESLAGEWYNQGYYGSVIHNVRGVYQRYMGWYDSNPVHLAAIDPVVEATQYVKAMGGRERVMEQAQTAVRDGNPAWAAVLYDKLVMSDAGDHQARNRLAKVYEGLAYAQENALWRNEYLTAALELRNGIPKLKLGSLTDSSILATLPSESLFDLLSVRLDPTKVKGNNAEIDLFFTDLNEHFRISVKNDVMWYQSQPVKAAGKDADAVVRGPRGAILGLIMAGQKSPKAVVSGEEKKVEEFADWFETPNPRFPLVWRDR